MCPFGICSVDHNEAQDCSQEFGPFDPNGARLDGDTAEFERLNRVDIALDCALGIHDGKCGH